MSKIYSLEILRDGINKIKEEGEKLEAMLKNNKGRNGGKKEELIIDPKP